jgi:glycosyltransferase involved in cell wall biosynthesis
VQPTVTLVVAMRNEARHIDACLRSIVGQDYPPDRLEILAIDGRSTDASRSIAERALEGRPLARVLENPDVIQAAAWNRGIDMASGDVIGIVSGHATLGPGYVASAVAALERTGATMVGGPVHAIGEGVVGTAIATASVSPFGVGGARHHYATEAVEVDTVFMGLCRAEDYRRHRFDPRMVRNQDDELSYRILDAGGRIVCDPTIQSTYASRSSFGGLVRQQFSYGRWKVLVLRRHPRQVRVRQLIPPIFVAALGGSAGLAIVSRHGRRLLGGIVATYGCAAGLATVAAPAQTPFRARALLPLVFGAMHIGYGAGILAGLIRLGQETTRGGIDPAPRA